MFQSYKGRSIMEGEVVEVFRNLTKDMWSIRGKRYEDGKWKTVTLGHTKSVVLLECEFNVSESGRQRVIREKKKYIHAVVKGKVCNFKDVQMKVGITYNPYLHEQFIRRDNGKEITNAFIVSMSSDMRVTAGI